jgi:hypothetical protein
MAQMMKTVKYEVNAWAKFITKLALYDDSSKVKLVKLFVSGAWKFYDETKFNVLIATNLGLLMISGAISTRLLLTRLTN